MKIRSDFRKIRSDFQKIRPDFGGCACFAGKDSNYLSEFLIKRDFSWVLKINRVVKTCKYGREGREGYCWKYGG